MTKTLFPPLAAAALLLFAPGLMAQEVDRDAEVVLGWAEPVDTLNPATTGARNVGSILTNIFDTLVWLTPQFEITPGLATDWTISDDALTYTFNLRQDVTFHDGTPFNAAAVVANIDYMNNPDTQSKIALGLLGPCASAEATAEFTVVFTCSAPYSPLLAQLGEPYLGIQSPKAIETYGADLGQHPTGTGAFRFVSHEPDVSAVFERNEDYTWMPAALGRNGPADIAKLTFQIVPNSQSRVSQFQSGQSQFMQQTPGIYWKSMAGMPEYTQMPVPISGLGIFAPINASKFPTDDIAVRKAIMHAIDKTGVVQLAEAGVFPVRNTPLQEDMLGYNPDLENSYPYDPELAKKLLEDAGWTRPGEFWEKDGRTLTLDITAISTVPSYPLLAQAMQGYLRDAGMDAQVRQLAVPAWLAANVAGDMSLTPLQYIGVDPDALHFWVLEGEYFNWSHWSDPALSELILAGQRELDPAKRTEVYHEAQQIIMDNAVIMPIRENIDLLTMTKNLVGVTYSGGGFEYFGAASLLK